MTNKIISNIVEKINELTTPENENEYCQWTIERVFEKINELATPAEPQKQAIIDFFVAFKGNVERELEAPLDDSLLGITADNAYIAGLKTAINIADNTASDVIDRLKLEPQQSIFDAEGWCSDFNKAPQDYDTPILVKYYCGWGKCKRVTVGHYEDAIADYSHESGFYTYYETGCIRETKKINDLISWKLLPTGASE